MINLINKIKMESSMDSKLSSLKQFFNSSIKKYTNSEADPYQQQEWPTISMKKCTIELFSIALMKDSIILDLIFK